MARRTGNGDSLERSRIRSFAAFVALVAGVALCVRAGAPLLIPAAFVVLLLPFEQTQTRLRYVSLLAGAVALAVLCAVIWATTTHRPALECILVASGLIFAALARIRPPQRRLP